MRSSSSSGTRSPETARNLAKAIERSKRKTSVGLPLEFVRNQADPDAGTPLAKLLQGGRGGEVRLKLYLCLRLLTTKPPYDIRQGIRSSYWAETLGLSDPETNGSRRTVQALAWLDRNGYIRLQRRPGLPSALELVNPLDRTKPFEVKGPRYVTLPLDVWSQEWIVALSGPALALFVVLREVTGGKDTPQPLATGRHAEYGLSEDTWTRAIAELTDHGLLHVSRVTDVIDLDKRRTRNAYLLDEVRLQLPPR